MDNNQSVWRYMSFSRFLWMLQRQRLRMSMADKLDEPWCPVALQVHRSPVSQDFSAAIRFGVKVSLQ
jgi:hypothetical protein